jgi:hypothetical protein
MLFRPDSGNVPGCGRFPCGQHLPPWDGRRLPPQGRIAGNRHQQAPLGRIARLDPAQIGVVRPAVGFEVGEAGAVLGGDDELDLVRVVLGAARKDDPSTSSCEAS